MDRDDELTQARDEQGTVPAQQILKSNQMNPRAKLDIETNRLP